MNIRRFFGATNREALREVRLALGADALIISNKRVNGGVEILATDPGSLPEHPSNPAPRPPAPAVRPAVGAAAYGALHQQSAPGANPGAAYGAAPSAHPGGGAAGFAASAPGAHPGAAYGAAPSTHPGGGAAGFAASAPGAHPGAAYGAAPGAGLGGGASSAHPGGGAAYGAAQDPAPGSAAPALSAALSGLEDQSLMGIIGDLRGSLESRIDDLMWGNQLRAAPQAASLFQSLLRSGFSTSLLRAMLKHLPAQLASHAAQQWARAELIKHLPVLASEESLWRPGLALALVGPTGVGKTTTVAKLAARCVRRAGPGSLVLITTDTYRIGAHEQLKIYGQMLRVPVHIVQDIHELQRVVKTITPQQTILIDNIGISQRDRYIHEQAALLAGSGRPIERILVLNAASHGDTLDEVARAYSSDGGTKLRGCIISKIDEASRLGAALDTAIRYKLPIHYVSNGQKVPENLLHLSATELVDRALQTVQSQRSLYAPTEADLAALLALTQAPATEQEQAARRRQEVLLPQLLTRTLGGESLKLEQMQAAVDSINNDPVLCEAYDLWHSRSSGKLPAAPEASEHLRRVALDLLGDSQAPGSRCAVVAHVRQELSWQKRRGAWCAAAWFDSAGQPLAAGAQQAGMPDGWHTMQGGMLQAPGSSDALLAQIQAEAASGVAGMWHVFEGGSQNLLRTLSAEGVRWLSLVNARASVVSEGYRCVLSAATRNILYQPLAQPLLPLRAPAGITQPGLSWWGACGAAELHARGQEPLPVRIFALRAADAHDGKLLRAWYALAGMACEPNPLLMARALIIRQEMQSAWRVASRVLSQDSGREPFIDRLMGTAQLGLAAWHLAQSPALEPAATVAARMLGHEQLAAQQQYAGLQRLLSLKELLAQSA